MIVSFSDVKDLKFCKGQAVYRVKTPRHEKAGPARVGTACHAVLMRYVRHCLDGKLATDIAHGRDLVVRIGSELSPADQANFEPMAMECIEGLTLDFLDGAQEVHIEERLFIDVDTQMQVTAVEAVQRRLVFAFTPDLWWIDAMGIMHVLDWKTGWVIEHVSAPDQNFQLRCYAGAIAHVTGVGAAFGHIYHCRWDYMETSGGKGEDVPQPWSCIDLAEEFRMQVLPLAELLFQLATNGGGAFTVGDHCLDCDFRGRCPAYAAMPGEKDHTMDDARLLITAAAIYKDRMTAARKRLRQIVDRDGPQATEKFKTAIVVTKGAVKPSIKEELAKLLMPEEVDACFSPSSTAIERIFKKQKMAELGEALVERHRGPDKSTRITLKRVGAGRDTEEEE